MRKGWLNDVLWNAKVSTYYMGSPQEHMQRGHTISLPIPTEEAEELFRRMNERFLAWTGVPIATWPSRRTALQKDEGE